MLRARFLASVTAGLLTLAAVAQPASATPLIVLGDTLASYGVLTFGDFGSAANRYSSDSEGPMAIGGNAYIESFYAASRTNNGGNALTVGGNLNFGNGQIGGNVFVGGNADFKDYMYGGGATVNGTLTVNGSVSTAPTSYQGTIQTGGTSPVNFGALRTDILAASSQLAATTSGTLGTVDYQNQWNQKELNLIGTSSGLNVFNIDGAFLSTFSGTSYSQGGGSFHFNIPTGATAIINVSGTNVSFGNGNFGFFCYSQWQSCDGSTMNNVLFNFYEATTLTMNSVMGSILAPLANVNFTNGQLNGSIIANSISGPLYQTGEFHDVPFTGILPAAVPAPNALFLLTAGLLALVAVGNRRRAQNQI